MPDPIGWAVLVVGALVGSLVGGVAGFGTGIIMLPLVAWVVGLDHAAMTAGRFRRLWAGFSTIAGEIKKSPLGRCGHAQGSLPSGTQNLSPAARSPD